MSKHNSSRYDSFCKYFEANYPYLKKDINHLGRIQSAATRLVKGLRGPTSEERPKALKLQLLFVHLRNASTAIFASACVARLV